MVLYNYLVNYIYIILFINIKFKTNQKPLYKGFYYSFFKDKSNCKRESLAV